MVTSYAGPAVLEGSENATTCGIGVGVANVTSSVCTAASSQPESSKKEAAARIVSTVVFTRRFVKYLRSFAFDFTRRD